MRKLSERDTKIKELNLKVQLLVDDSANVQRVQAEVTARDVALIAMLVAASRSTKTLEVMTRVYVSLRSELDVLDASGRCPEPALRDFVERLCTGYSRLVRTHASSFQNRLNELLSDVQSKEE